MKTIWLAALMATCAQAQNVFLLGSNTTPPPDLNGYSAPPATAAAAPAAANVCVNVNVNGASPACTYPAANPYYAQYNNGYYPQQQYYSPNVMYIGGPGTCGPNYYNNYYSYPSSSVIYFGGLQAYRHGYTFRHCR